MVLSGATKEVMERSVGGMDAVVGGSEISKWEDGKLMMLVDDVSGVREGVMVDECESERGISVARVGADGMGTVELDKLVVGVIHMSKVERMGSVEEGK